MGIQLVVPPVAQVGAAGLRGPVYNSAFLHPEVVRLAFPGDREAEPRPRRLDDLDVLLGEAHEQPRAVGVGLEAIKQTPVPPLPISTLTQFKAIVQPLHEMND